MTTVLLLTALATWAVMIAAVVAGFYLIKKINEIERKVREIEEAEVPIEPLEGTVTLTSKGATIVRETARKLDDDNGPGEWYIPE